jgi:transposase
MKRLAPFQYSCYKGVEPRKEAAMLYVGVDQHKKHSYCTVKDEDNEVVFQGKVPSTREGIEAFLESFPEDELAVALEAGPSWQWLYDLLEGKVSRVDLVNPKACKAIASAKLKNDKMDSLTLATLLKADILPTCYVPSEEERSVREVVRGRAFLVRIRVRLKNRIHSILARQGVVHGYSDLFGKGGRGFLESLEMPFPYKEEVESLLGLVDHLDGEIKKLDFVVERLVGDCPQAFRIARIGGIGYYSALLIVSEIGDVSRFRNAKKLFSYAGIIPSERSSGDKVRRGPITKEGSSWLRWALIEAAQRQEWMTGSPFREDFRRIASRKGNKVARVAVARKMLKRIYEMLKEYREETQRARGGLRV